MRGSAIERALWGAAIALGIAAAVGWGGAAGDAMMVRTGIVAVAASAASPADEVIQRAGARVAEADPFRAARHPSPVAYHPDVEGAPPPPPRPPRPVLLLTGIIGGPPWQAVLEGVPGQEGSVVARRGDVFGPLVVRAVKRDTVIVTGMDTAWKLTVRTAW